MLRPLWTPMSRPVVALGAAITSTAYWLLLRTATIPDTIGMVIGAGAVAVAIAFSLDTLSHIGAVAIGVAAISAALRPVGRFSDSVLLVAINMAAMLSLLVLAWTPRHRPTPAGNWVFVVPLVGVCIARIALVPTLFGVGPIGRVFGTILATSATLALAAASSSSSATTMRTQRPRSTEATRTGVTPISALIAL
jgi:hypothetical protein